MAQSDSPVPFPPNARAAYYRKRAQEAERDATNVHDSKLRDAFIELAAKWRHLAEELEK
jgi:hypothetical protein